MKNILLVCSINIICVVTTYVSYAKTSNMLRHGIFVDGMINIIRATAKSHYWVYVSYAYKDEIISKEMELSKADFNKDMSIHLLLDSQNPQQFRILPTTKQHEPEFSNTHVYLFLICLAAVLFYTLYLGIESA